ncbi:hypothetical protein B0H63DRAFT_498167 [Podospora didyma]|uniref:ADF-H domain-containing protein n=1 Tax=Podospora didyma TaxID=330526 RepID=A0AAE0N1W7_9PEZI|nr:hypothetical protein B0H63DRAFT_498167 [Podospora didyma]
MQSGISASQELVSKFNELLADSNHFGLLLLPSSSSSFAANVSSQLTPRLKPNEALYIILRRHADTPALAAVTYVPDAAPVRQKMLFASTRLTLVRELGSEHFRETIFATLASELSPAGFEKHDAHTALDAPLTEEERTLGEVRRTEQEASSGTGTREIHLSKSLAIPISDDGLAALKELAGNSGRDLVMLSINTAAEKIELVPDSSTPTSIPDLVKTISSTEPRFTFYRFEHSYGGNSSSPVLFFYTCPATGGTKAIKSRMIYPLMKRAILAIAEKEAGFEITEASVLEELHPKVEVRQGFSRPKRPSR